MGWAARVGDPRVLAALVAIASCFLLAYLAAVQFGTEDTGGGFAWIGSGGDTSRILIGFDAVVAPGDTLVVDLSATDSSRCGQNPGGLHSCVEGPPGSPEPHPADTTATFYITEVGDAERLVRGELPRHVLASAAAPDAWRTQFRIERPPIPEDILADGDDERLPWLLRDSRGVILVFWLLESGGPPVFDAAADPGRFTFGNEDAFPPDWSHIAWIEKSWYPVASTILRILVVISGALVLMSALAWLSRGPRTAYRQPVPASAESHLEFLAAESTRLASLMRRVLGYGTIIILVIGLAAAATFAWYEPQRAPSNLDSEGFELPLGPAAGIDFFRWAVLVGAALGGLVWFVAAWSVTARWSLLNRHLANAPEI